MDYAEDCAKRELGSAIEIFRDLRRNKPRKWQWIQTSLEHGADHYFWTIIEFAIANGLAWLQTQEELSTTVFEKTARLNRNGMIQMNVQNSEL